MPNQNKQSYKSFKLSNQRRELKTKVNLLEREQEDIKKSISNSSVMLLVIGVFARIFFLVFIIAALIDFPIGSTTDEQRVMSRALIVTLLLTTPIAKNVVNKKKRAVRESLEKINTEIQELSNKIKSIK